METHWIVVTELWKSRASVCSATFTIVMSSATMNAPSMIATANRRSSGESCAELASVPPDVLFQLINGQPMTRDSSAVVPPVGVHERVGGGHQLRHLFGKTKDLDALTARASPTSAPITER